MTAGDLNREANIALAFTRERRHVGYERKHALEQLQQALENDLIAWLEDDMDTARNEWQGFALVTIEDKRRPRFTEAQQEHLAAERVAMNNRELAYTLAATTARRLVEDALDDMRVMNFGAARETLRNLVDNGLPNDHGGPVTHHPLYEREMANIEGREAQRS